MGREVVGVSHCICSVGADRGKSEGEGRELENLAFVHESEVSPVLKVDWKVKVGIFKV